MNVEAINHQIRDDGNHTKRTIANNQELIDKQNAIALVSFYGTNNTSELIKSKTLERVNIALIGVHSSADIIRNHPYIFHTHARFCWRFIRGCIGCSFRARITVEAIRRSGKNPSRSGVYNALNSLKSYDLGEFNLDFNDKNAKALIM